MELHSSQTTHMERNNVVSFRPLWNCTALKRVYNNTNGMLSFRPLWNCTALKHVFGNYINIFVLDPYGIAQLSNAELEIDGYT